MRALKYIVVLAVVAGVFCGAPEQEQSSKPEPGATGPAPEPSPGPHGRGARRYGDPRLRGVDGLPGRADPPRAQGRPDRGFGGGGGFGGVDRGQRVGFGGLAKESFGGIFIVDDLGRQAEPPQSLVNRWIVPLESRRDFLTLSTGKKIQVPFEQLIIFSTNLEPADLVDEAFLRRIRYKIMVESPNRRQYEEIFRRCCESNDILYEPTRVEHVYRQFYERLRMAPRGCHPRDIVDTVCNIAKYENVQPSLSIELLDRACRSYFLDVPGAGSVVGQYALGDEE